MNVAQAIASACVALRNCEAREPNGEWADRWATRLAKIERECLPSGSGFDAGTTIERDDSGAYSIRLQTSFHHMNDAGFYERWTDHTVIARASFIGEHDLIVRGRDHRQIKEYIADTMGQALSRAITWEELD